MLGKLFKYEFKNTAKVMLTIYGLFIVTTLMGAAGFAGIASGSGEDSAPLVIRLLIYSSVFLYVLSLFALFVVTYIYVCIHFYKTMYSDQGYLTHTLPVKPLALFNVKLATSWVWLMGSILLFCISLFVIMFAAFGRELLSPPVVIDYGTLRAEFVSVMGMSMGQFILLMVFMMAFSCIGYLLIVYTCISIGQLFNQHKLVWAFVTGIVLYFIEQVTGSLVLLVTGGSFFSNTMHNDIVTFSDIFTSTPFIASYTLSILFAIAYYVICVVIQKRHLNLD